ncbi:MAG TPA: phosphatidate cytidylyltransferase [Candidatus Eisenbacteria bacterium]
MNAIAARWSALPAVARMAGIILALLIVASITVAVLRRGGRRPGFEELSARVRSWWVMAAVFFAAIAVDQRLSLVFFGLLSFWALKEYVTLLPTRRADHRALLWSFLAVPIQYVWAAIGWYGMFIIFIPVYMFLLVPLQLMLIGLTSGFVTSVAQIQWGLMAFVFGLSHLGYLVTMPAVPGSAASGRSLVLFLVFVTEMSDVLQYVWGKLAGRHKILPTVSPNKTWEGFLGGIATTALLSLGVRFLTPFSVLETLGVTLLVTVLGFCGGGVMSAVKRDFHVKDFGVLIPGHGGMLDRVDSLCYAAPVFFHYVRYFHYH